MDLRTYKKALLGTLLTTALLAGCDGSSSNLSKLADVIDNGGTLPQADISPAVLDSAASFLGAATGKEIPLSVDSVVFINSALGLNDVPNDPQNLFGDLWMVVRDAYGVPVLDANGCMQPIASETITLPDGTTTDTVPMVLDTLEEEPVCAVEEGYEQYTIELEIGRLNMVRTMTQNPTVFARALEEAIKNINASESVKLDPAGRLILVSSDPVTGAPVESTIDSPRENLALYNALLKEGRIAGYGPEKHEGGQTIAPQWLEIRDDLDLGDLAYLRDGTPGRDHGVDLHEGYADLSQAVHDRQMDYATQLLSYIQYYDDGSTCHYRDESGYAWERVFGLEEYYGANINGFTTHADDARRTIVFMHDVIQDMPESPLQTLPNGRFDLMHAAAAFLGGASNKSVPLTIDGLVFINTVLRLNEGVDFTNKGEVFGDLWALERDVNGVPVLDENGCPQPISVNGGFVPMVLDPDSGECVIVEGYEDDVVELELGRLNVVRVALTNPRVLDRALYDVVENSINNSVGLQLDLSGRLAYGVEDADTGAVTYKTVDSPLAGLAMYSALMRWGSLEGDVEIMVDGSWVTHPLVINDAGFTDVSLAEAGLEFLKAGGSSSGVGHLASGHVDYSSFSHTTETIYSGANVDFVERQPDDLSCAYGDRTADVWVRVLGSDGYTGTNIDAFVKQAEDTRNVIQFIHTVIQDPLPEVL